MDEVVEFRGGKDGFVGGHGSLAAELFQIAEFAFAETMEAALLVLELNEKSVFVETDPANRRAGTSDRLDEEKIFGDGFGGILQSFAQTRGPAACAHVSEFRAVAGAFSCEDMTSGAAASGVNSFAARGIAGDNFGRNISEASSIRRDVGDFFWREIPGRRHIRLNAIFDDGLEGVVIRSMSEFCPPKRWTAAAAAVDSMAQGAVAFKNEFACRNVRGGGWRGWSGTRWFLSAARGCGKQDYGKHGCSEHTHKSLTGIALLNGSVGRRLTAPTVTVNRQRRASILCDEGSFCEWRLSNGETGCSFELSWSR